MKNPIGKIPFPYPLVQGAGKIAENEILTIHRRIVSAFFLKKLNLTEIIRAAPPPVWQTFLDHLPSLPFTIRARLRMMEGTSMD